MLDAPLAVPSGATVDLTGVTVQYAFDVGEFGLLHLEDVDDITIIGGVFDGNVAGQSAWREHQHALKIVGSRNVRVEGCRFFNLAGDGVLVMGGSEHVTVDGNEFTGQHSNRNGISVTWASHVRITNNRLEGMTRPGMPGPIDIEPDDPTNIIEDIYVGQNRIISHAPDVTRAPYAGILLFNQIAHAPISNVVIEDNDLWGRYQKAIWIAGDGSYSEGPITVRRNRLHDIPLEQPIQVTNASAEVYQNDIQGGRKKRPRKRWR